MSYQIDPAGSAKRHWHDGQELLKVKRAQAAGYHFGFAAECAIKTILYKHNIPRSNDRRDDPYWVHFPRLRTLLIREGKGRLSQKLYELVSQGSFLQDWDTDIRYAADGSVDASRAMQWRDQADAVFGIVFY